MVEPETLPPGWAMVKVASVGAIQLGLQRSPDRQLGRFPTPYLRAANITLEGLSLEDVLTMDFEPDERDAFRLMPGDVLLAEASGSAEHVGRPAIWRGEIDDCCFQNTIIRFRPHAVTPEFALLVFRHYAESGLFSGAARGVGIQHLGGGRLAQLPFPLPPWPEQARIVAETERRLSDIAAAETALLSARLHIGEQERLVVEAAVTGSLVETEAARCARDGVPFEPASSLLDAGERSARGSLFDHGREDDIRQEGPADGWAMAPVEAIGEVRLGRQRAPKYEQGDHPVPYIRAANITTSGLVLDDVLTMNFTPEEQKRYALQTGDVLLAEASGSAAQVGRSAVWADEIAACCFQNTVIRFRPRLAEPDYAWLVFRHMAESGLFAQTARGVGIQHLGAARLAGLPFPLPPAAEQKRIVAEARKRLDACRAQRRAIDSSLSRFSAMRRETWSAAVAGRLTPQQPDDEPADALLTRLGPPPELRRATRAANKEGPMDKARGRKSQTPSVRRLTEVLAEKDGPVKLPELFASAGYNRDDIEDVERFYIALRGDLDVTIEAIGEVSENIEVAPRNAS